MGESYRGLTIRLGADSTELTKALKSVNSAARATQSELRRVTQGLRLEPGNVELASLKMSRLGDAAQDSALRLATLRRAEGQLSGTRIEALAEKTRNAALQTQRVTEAYNDVNAALERVNRRMAELSTAKGPLDEASLKSQRAELEALSAEQRRLAGLHESYQAQLEDAKGVERLRNLKVEIAATAAETRDAARRMAELAEQTGSVGERSAESRRVREALEADEAAAKALRQEFGRLSDASGLGAAAQRMRNVAEQTEVARERLARLREAARGIRESGIDDAGRSMRQLAQETEAARARFAEVKTAVAEAAAKLDQLEAEARSLGTAGQGGTEGFRALSASIGEARADVARLAAEEREASRALDTAAAREELRAYRSEIRETQARLQALSGRGGSGLGGTLSSLGMTMSATVTPTVLNVGYGVINAADEIDSAFRDMKKTVNGTDEDFEALRQSAIEFSKTHVTSADTILEIEAMGGQLGIAVDQLQEFADVASNLDIATDMDADDIAQTLGQLNNVLDWGEGDMERYANALTRLGNNMPAQESAITDITKRIGAAAHMYGMSTPQILAWSSAIAATGQNSEAAGTAVSNSLSDVENAVAKGGDSLQAFADVAGMSAEDFADKWNSDASGAFQDFIVGLGRIESEGGSADVTLTDLGITGVRQKQALKGLSQTIGTLNDAMAMSGDAWDGVDDQWGRAGDAANEAAQKSEGFSGALGMLKNTAQALGSEVGEAMTPLIEAVTEALKWLESLFSSLTDGQQTAVVFAAAVAGVAGPALTLASSLARAVSKSNLLGTAALKVIGVLGKFPGIASPMGLVIGGLATAAALAAKAFYDYQEHASKAQKATKGLEDACRNASGDVSSFTGDVSAVGESAETSFGKARQSADDLTDSLSDLADEISGRHGDVNAQNHLLDTYRDTVEELGGRADLTTEDMGRLRTAVEGINDVCGTNWQVVQDAGGAYQVMADGALVAKDAIDKLVDSKMIEAQLSAYQQDYEDLAKKEKEATDAIADAATEYAQAKEDYDRYTQAQNDANYKSQSWYLNGAQADTAAQKMEEAKQAGEDAEAEYASVLASIDTVNSSIGTLYNGIADGADEIDRFAANNVSVLTSALASSHDKVAGMTLSVSDLTAALKDSGVSAEQLATLTPTQLATLAASFDGTTASVVTSLQQMVDGFTQSNAAIADAALDPAKFANGYQDLAYWLGQAGVSTEQFASLSAEQAQGLSDAMNQADGTAQGYVSAILGYLMSLDGGFADSAMTAQDAMDQLAACFDPEGNGVAENLNAFAASLDEQGLTSAAQFVRNFADTLSEGAGDAQAATEDINEAVGEAQDAGAEESGEAGAETADEYTQGVSDGTDDAQGAATQVADAATTALSSTDTYSLGSAFGQGYVNGILDKVGAASSAGAQLAQAAASATQSAQQSHSPSRVTRRLGSYFSQGYALGIGDDSALPGRSARAMVRDTLAAVRDAYAGVSMASLAGGAAYGAGAAGTRAAASAYRGVTKADVFDAMDAALRANSGGEVAVYVDGKRLAQSLSRNMDAQLGVMAARRSR